MVLIGDEKQLPATVVDRKAAQLGLGISFFERCVRDQIVTPGNGFIQLDVQRRMHPSISAFPFGHFYGGDVSDGKELLKRSARPPVDGFPWQGQNMQVCFVDMVNEGGGGDGSGDPAGGAARSHSNRGEADLLVDVLESCINRGTEPADIAVVTGYSAQQSLLTRTIRSRVPDAFTRGLRVDTVDGFQGAERDLVLISTVRANTRGQVGFLKDQRRVNVMLTRARRGMVVFGDSSTLKYESQSWSPWLKWIWKSQASLEANSLRWHLKHPASFSVARSSLPEEEESEDDYDVASASPPPAAAAAEASAVDEAVGVVTAERAEDATTVTAETSNFGGGDGEWERYQDPESGEFWLYNSRTHESKWAKKEVQATPTDTRVLVG